MSTARDPMTAPSVNILLWVRMSDSLLVVIVFFRARKARVSDVSCVGVC